MLPCLLALLSTLALLAGGMNFNVSIDDQYGDERTQAVPSYSPSWTARSLLRDPCGTNCSAHPDAHHAHNETWHEWLTNVNDPPATVSISFTGTKVYVYCILFNQPDDPPASTTRLSFFMDGFAQPAGQFLHTFNPALETYLYDQLVFTSDAMPHGNHTLELRSSSDGKTGSLAMFDYAVYTTGESPLPERSSSPSSGRLKLIAASVASGAAAVLLATSTVCIYCNRRRVSKSSIETSNGVRPFIGHLHRGVTAWRIGLGSQDAPEKGLPLFESKMKRRNSEVSAQLRTEMQQMREELERVRRIAEPPGYAHPAPV